MDNPCQLGIQGRAHRYLETRYQNLVVALSQIGPSTLGSGWLSPNIIKVGRRAGV
jgi:hypothetical protein